MQREALCYALDGSSSAEQERAQDPAHVLDVGPRFDRFDALLQADWPEKSLVASPRTTNARPRRAGAAARRPSARTGRRAPPPLVLGVSQNSMSIPPRSADSLANSGIRSYEAEWSRSQSATLTPGTVFDTSTGAPSSTSEGAVTHRSDATQVGA
jgi:hypothetical protein